MNRAEVAAAFVAGRPAKTGSTHTDGTTLWLHGQAVARRSSAGIQVTWAGWGRLDSNRLTRDWLNAICEAARSPVRFGLRPLTAVLYQPMEPGQPVVGDAWMSI